MRRAKWLAVCGALLMSAAVMAKPPEVPMSGGGEGRVPVYPEGERFREPTPKSAPPTRKSNKGEITPHADWTGIGIWWLEMPLILPPLDL
jgi:hypothetical protein